METRILSLDLGEKNIGIALSDTLKMIASPVKTIPRRSRKEDFATIAELCRQQNVVLIVIGLPLMLDGSEGAMAAWARDYGRGLSESTGIPVQFWDESFSSDMAIEALRAQGYSRKKMKEKGKLDAVAAALILQNFLETRDERPETRE
ncbi:MAG: Holliday junction resolvase RuvX [Ardenticatenaceae bacterium]|nr:Holliday junction resolvase RuvX [Ardenticatenaceae bacterium]